ncbi:MAG: UDP-2,3-diacylglucosamine diphosphatase, partial [Burkholderiaceae bacterium]|nr:UDP-2,3-diacylglucosamine diphosphatase [Burkholderiaceae bacterium]
WTLDGRAAERWVLPDWDFDAAPARGGYLVLERAGRAILTLHG